MISHNRMCVSENVRWKGGSACRMYINLFERQSLSVSVSVSLSLSLFVRELVRAHAYYGTFVDLK